MRADVEARVRRVLAKNADVRLVRLRSTRDVRRFLRLLGLQDADAR